MRYRTQSPLDLYEKYRPQMKTGDVIGFSGNAGFSSVIKWATGSIYSHVGLVLNARLPGGFGDSVLLIESTTETEGLDATNSQLIKGVQLHWLSKRIMMYDGSVWWAPLKQPLPQEGLEEMQAWLRQTHNQQVRYDSVQVMGAGLDLFDRWKWENRESVSALFCSELVTKALKIAGVVDSNLNASEQTPQDVMSFSCLDQALPIKVEDKTEDRRSNK